MRKEQYANQLLLCGLNLKSQMLVSAIQISALKKDGLNINIR